jgi:hypothetical protein
MNQIGHHGQPQDPGDGQHLVKPRTEMKIDADPFQKPPAPAFLRCLFQSRSPLAPLHSRCAVWGQILNQSPNSVIKTRLLRCDYMKTANVSR